MRVTVGRDDPRTLSDELADLGLRTAVAMVQADPPMTERVRREVRHRGITASTTDYREAKRRLELLREELATRVEAGEIA